MLDKRGVARRPTTVKNPRSNATCKRLHQTAASALRPLARTPSPPQNIHDAAAIIDAALSAAACSARAAVRSTLRISPGALTLHRDTILSAPIIADLEPSQQQQRALVDKNPVRANCKRASHDHQPGDEVSLLTCKPDRLEPRAAGPRAAHLARTNGAATINRNPCVRQRLNTRRLRPCFREQVTREGFILVQGSFRFTFCSVTFLGSTIPRDSRSDKSN